MIEYDNARYGTLSGFFSCGSANRLGGSGASVLAALRFGWEEWIFHFCFPSSGSRFFSYFLFIITIYTRITILNMKSQLIILA